GSPGAAAVKFDLYSNQGEGANSTGLYQNGALPTVGGSINLANSGVDLHSGHVFHVAIAYDGATLNVKLIDTVTKAFANQSYAIDLPSTVGASAYVGFTGATGGLT